MLTVCLFVWYKESVGQGFCKAQYNLAHYEEKETLQLNY